LKVSLTPPWFIYVFRSRSFKTSVKKGEHSGGYSAVFPLLYGEERIKVNRTMKIFTGFYGEERIKVNRTMKIFTGL
jgi:hypothetical protein